MIDTWGVMKIKCDDCLAVGVGRLLFRRKWWCQDCLWKFLMYKVERSKMSEPRLKERLLTALDMLREGVDADYAFIDKTVMDAIEYVGWHEEYKNMANGPKAPCESCRQLKAELECLKYEMSTVAKRKGKQ